MSEEQEEMLILNTPALEATRHSFSIEDGYLIIYQSQGYKSKIIGRIKYEEVEE